jgi:biopolymer transport protein ExbD
MAEDVLAAGAEDNLSPRIKAKKNYRRLRRNIPQGDDVSYLNITAMMDMMTIILVFFLKSFSTSVENIPIGEELMPPKSTTQVKPHAAVTVTLTQKAILVEDEPVAAVKRGGVDSSVKRDGQSGYQITPLLTVLQKHATRLRKIEKMTGGRMKFTGEVVLIADQGTPYRLISEVLYTAGQAEYSKYRLLVLRK